MSNLFEQANNIVAAEKLLESYLNKNLLHDNIIMDIPMSRDDCHYLVSEITRLINTYAPVNFYEEIPLCLISSWAYSIRYKVELADAVSRLREAIQRIPQHHARFYIMILSNALTEYSIENFSINPNTYDGLLKIMQKHASFGS